MELVDFCSYIKLYRLYRKSLLFQYICLTCYNFAPTYVYFCFFLWHQDKKASFFRKTLLLSQENSLLKKYILGRGRKISPLPLFFCFCYAATRYVKPTNPFIRRFRLSRRPGLIGIVWRAICRISSSLLPFGVLKYSRHNTTAILKLTR